MKLQKTQYLMHTTVCMICTILALASLPSVEAGNESGLARESFHSRNKKATLQSMVMNNILVIFTDNYITTYPVKWSNKEFITDVDAHSGSYLSSIAIFVLFLSTVEINTTFYRILTCSISSNYGYIGY